MGCLTKGGGGGKDAKGTESNVQLCCGFCQSGSRLYDGRVLLPSRAYAGELKCSSPLLFSFFINELTTTIRVKGTHGVQFVQGMADVFLLLFADNVALVSLTPGGLQNQLNNLKAEADRLKLEINQA